MLKSFIILLSSITFVFASLDEGDSYYNKQDYIKALAFYTQEYKMGQDKKEAKIRLVVTLIKLGDNFFNIQDYKKAKLYYLKAYKFGSELAKKKLSKVYEKEGDLYKRGNRYKAAYDQYDIAYKLGNKAVEKRKKRMKALLEHQIKLVNDKRKIVSKDSPLWTKAIGRLIVPTKLEKVGKYIGTKIEKCSATLVNFADKSSSKIIISASHCVMNFDPDAGIIRFIIRAKNGELIQKYAKVLKDSKFDIKKIKSRSDYTIFVLSSSIDKKEVTPLIVPQKSFYELQRQYKVHYGSLGGFSSDIGEFGSFVSYDPKCLLHRYNSLYGKSDCSGFKGASGGPVVLTVFDKNKEYKSFFVGVVSHFKNKQYQHIFFTPQHIFYNDIKKAIEQYNQ